MEGIFKLKNIDTIEATLELTLTIDHWKRLSKQLGTIDFFPFPAAELRTIITDLIDDLEEKLKRDTEDEEV